MIVSENQLITCNISVIYFWLVISLSDFLLNCTEYKYLHNTYLLLTYCRSFQFTSTVVLVVQWFGVGLVVKRSLVRLPAGALSSQLGQLSLPSLRGR